MSENSTASKVPPAYLRGEQDFYGRQFLVTPAVLIPRPETEQLIDMVLTLAGKSYLPGVKAGPPRLPPNPRIMDVGTGSGCIAITLALELPEATVMGVDVSREAIEVAKKNAARLNATSPFIISHLLEKVNREETPDVVVANLPYVDPDWEWLDKEALGHEPEVALYAEQGGLALILKLIEQAAERQVAWLILEADPCQHERVIEFAAKHGYGLARKMGYILGFRYLR